MQIISYPRLSKDRKPDAMPRDGGGCIGVTGVETFRGIFSKRKDRFLLQCKNASSVALMMVNILSASVCLITALQHEHWHRKCHLLPASCAMDNALPREQRLR